MSSDSTVRAFIAPILAGIGPVRRFSNKIKTWSAASEVKLEGIEPTNKLKPTSKCCNDVMSPIVEGIGPVMELLPITRLVILWKYPISDGRDPSSCKEFSSIFSTLA